MLVTDLDGTFIGDEEATLRLWDGLDQAGIGLVFATGRHLDAVHDLYRSLRTRRRADACICMVGTEIWIRRRLGYRRDRGWSQVIGAHWDRAAVVAVVEPIGGLTLQHDEWQSPFKVSWFVDGEAVVARVRSVLERRGLRATVVYSGGNLLDLLPEGAGKGSAAAFLARRLGVAAAAVVTAGDSGNDLDMMRPEFGFSSIVVGNAEPDLHDLSAPHIYHASQPYADGIAEGLQHFGWLGRI